MRLQRSSLLAHIRVLGQMMSMGGLASMLEKLPLPGNVNSAALKDAGNEQKMRRQIGIINSMTPGERRFPKTINGSRKKRIAAGAGQQILFVILTDGVEETKTFDVPAVPTITRVGDHQVIKRALFRASARKSNTYHYNSV